MFFLLFKYKEILNDIFKKMKNSLTSSSSCTESESDLDIDERQIRRRKKSHLQTTYRSNKKKEQNIEKTLLNTPTNKQNLPVLVGYLKN